MKKLILLFAVVLSLNVSAQVIDTLVSISNSPITSLARKACPNTYNWDFTNQTMSLLVTIYTYDGSGALINNLQIHPYSVTITTDKICVMPNTGSEVPCTTPGSVPQYPFLRALSLKPISIMAEILQYISVADGNGTFNN